MKKVLLFILIATCSYGQLYNINKPIFYNESTLANVAGDTMASISSADSIDIQMGNNGQWKLLTQTLNDTAWVTANDKSTETQLTFNLAAEDYWTHVEVIRFRFRSTGVDTVTSLWVPVGNLRGSVTLEVLPDTIGTNTDYGKSYIHGN